MNLKDKLLLKELLKRHTNADLLAKKPQRSIDLRCIDHLHDKQMRVLESKAKRKVIVAGRRSGKSHLITMALLYNALSYPESETLYIALTRESAKRLIWELIKKTNRQLSLNIQFNESELIAKLPNGSKIRVTGCPNRSDCEKYRGSAYRFVAIDEAGSFSTFLQYLVTDVLDYALQDYDGELWLVGTPNASATGFFHDAANKLPEWEHHNFSILDNQYFPRWSGLVDWQTKAQDYLKAKLKKKGWNEQNPIYRREDLAEWVRDGECLVVPFNDQRNTYTELPRPANWGGWHWIMGADFGFNDATALVLGCFSEEYPSLYIHECYQRSFINRQQDELVYETICSELKKLYDQYQPEVITADPASSGKLFIEDLATRHKLPIQAADKRNRQQSIELVNDDFRTGKIKVNAALFDEIQELKILQWGNKMKGEFASNFADHFYDALRYLWVESRHSDYAPQNRTMAQEDECLEYWHNKQQQMKAEREYNEELQGFEW